MSASKKAVAILCSQCPESQYLCGCLVVDCHAASELRKTIAEAQLEAIERYESLYDCTFRADYECGENVQTGKSFIAQKSYLAELKKAAGRGNDEREAGKTTVYGNAERITE